MSAPIPKDPDDWFHMDDPLPTDSDTLVQQIKRTAQARRYAAIHHDNDCSCNGCRVRHISEARERARLRNIA